MAERKKIKWKRFIYCLTGAVIILSGCPGGGILARYIRNMAADPGQILAEKFYFTTDLLGDTRMVSANKDLQEAYCFGEKSTEGIWYLYGNHEHKIHLQVQNYFDDLRVENSEIRFVGEVVVQDAKGSSISMKKGSSFPVLKQGEDKFSEGLFLNTSEKQSMALTLEIPSSLAWNYENGSTVTVKIRSVKPYKKNLIMSFILNRTDAELKYKVIDRAGRPYAELILMSDSADTLQPYINWVDGLLIDNTNSLTFICTKGNFMQQPGMESRNMQISQPLKAGQSETIYFFKSDVNENYTMSETIVKPNAENRYIIQVGMN